MFCLGQKKTCTPWRVRAGALVRWCGALLLVFGGASVVASTVANASTAAAARVPVVAAESEQFEIVGRWYAAGLQFHVDRAESNAPVENAQLAVEAAGKEITAVYDASTGVYHIDDAVWLAPLRAPGEHPLSFTLLAGEGADLLAGDLLVSAEVDAGPQATTAFDLKIGLLLPLVLVSLGMFVWRRRAQRGAA